MSLRTRLAFKLGILFFFISITIGFGAIAYKLPMLVTSAWLLKTLFLVFMISLVVGIVSFTISWFIDYITNLKTVEELKKNWPNLLCFASLGALIYIILNVIWFWSYTDTNTNDLFSRLVLIFSLFIFWELAWCLIWFIYKAISYPFDKKE